MLNGIFVAAVLLSVLLAAYTGQMEALTKAVLEDAIKAAELAIGLIGVMAFFLGLMRVAEDGGLLRTLARVVGPVLCRLFPGVPRDHPALSSMILNISSNMLGLGNAATPFGIKAMEQLDSLNSQKGTATNAMVLFLAINTAGMAILPSGVVGMRARMGSEDPAGIFFTTWVASGTATLVGIVAAFLLSRLPRYRATQPAPLVEVPVAAAAGDEVDGEAATEPLRPPRGGKWWVGAFWLLLAGLLVRYLWISAPRLVPRELFEQVMSFWILPVLVAGMVLYGWSRGVRVYDSLVEGAKEGFKVALRIIPYLVAILVAVGMLRESGWVELMVRFLGPVTNLIGLPAEAMPLVLLRPLTGGGSYGVMTSIMEQHGPDSFIGYMVSTLQGSTETTFYVLAVYFGAVGIRRTRHALPACLLADAGGILAGTFIVNALFG